MLDSAARDFSINWVNISASILPRETPFAGGDFADCGEVAGGAWLGFGREIGVERVEFRLIFTGEDNLRAAESVFECVEGAGATAGFGFGPCGAERIAAIGRELLFGWHGEPSL